MGWTTRSPPSRPRPPRSRRSRRCSTTSESRIRSSTTRRRRFLEKTHPSLFSPSQATTRPGTPAARGTSSTRSSRSWPAWGTRWRAPTRRRAGAMTPSRARPNCRRPSGRAPSPSPRTRTTPTRRTPTPTPPSWCAWTWTTTRSRTSPPPSARTPTRRSSRTRTRNACCSSFSRDRDDAFDRLSERELYVLADHPMPPNQGNSSGRKQVNALKRLRAHLGVDDSDLRGRCAAADHNQNAMGAVKLSDVLRVVHVYAEDVKPQDRPPRAVMQSLLRRLTSLADSPRAPASAARGGGAGAPARPKQPRWVERRERRPERPEFEEDRYAPSRGGSRGRSRGRGDGFDGARRGGGLAHGGVLVGTRTTTAITDATRRRVRGGSTTSTTSAAGSAGARSRRRRGVRRVRLGRRVGHAPSPVSARERVR